MICFVLDLDFTLLYFGFRCNVKVCDIPLSRRRPESCRDCCLSRYEAKPEIGDADSVSPKTALNTSKKNVSRNYIYICLNIYKYIHKFYYSSGCLCRKKDSFRKKRIKRTGEHRMAQGRQRPCSIFNSECSFSFSFFLLLRRPVGEINGNGFKI